VTNQPDLKSTTMSRRCRESSIPYLPEGTAWRKAAKLVDPGYRSKDFTSKGGNYGRVSYTRFSFLFHWGSDTDNCLQEIKVALVDGSVVGNAGEVACAPLVSWPRARGTAPRQIGETTGAPDSRQ
jgi:hypothetical protein